MSIPQIAITAAPYALKAGKWGVGRIRERRCVSRAMSKVDTRGLPKSEVQAIRCRVRKICRGMDAGAAVKACYR